MTFNDSGVREEGKQKMNTLQRRGDVRWKGEEHLKWEAEKERRES